MIHCSPDLHFAGISMRHFHEMKTRRKLRQSYSFSNFKTTMYNTIVKYPNFSVVTGNKNARCFFNVDDIEYKRCGFASVNNHLSRKLNLECWSMEDLDCAVCSAQPHEVTHGTDGGHFLAAAIAREGLQVGNP